MLFFGLELHDTIVMTLLSTNVQRLLLILILLFYLFISSRANMNNLLTFYFNVCPRYSVLDYFIAVIRTSVLVVCHVTFFFGISIQVDKWLFGYCLSPLECYFLSSPMKLNIL